MHNHSEWKVAILFADDVGQGEEVEASCFPDSALVTVF